ncbi:LppC putative lipoprotein [Thioalkalivibrio nitratireducens DSM 14787]|uniref:LppC putative lipoprotein n=1 Tax=Thioalkalivibrio nitratireducens (strain DSM 14787 / UNIQEM 213 / ALEN2) TaxID=1255043 RepID=L0E0S4_THIND|nr:LppC putative lipoprotein [Thioalkalivibrio nitratireducens DSM 14787]
MLALDGPDGGLLLRAERLWSRLPEAGSAHLADRYRGARLAWVQNAPGTALERLPPVDGDPDSVLHFDALALHAELLTTTGTWNGALRARIALDPRLLEDPARQQENQQFIWNLLATVETIQRAQLRGRDASEAERGWAELFAALRTAGADPQAFDRAADEWGQAHPGHNARILLPDLREATLRLDAPPRRIAVLLPLSGSLAELGNAVLDGISARLTRDHGYGVPLRVFDTEGEPALAEAHYRNAIGEGVDRIIGPLTREAVDRVAAIGAGPPTLLLNQPVQPLPESFSVLSLAPEDDARAAAAEARATGWHNALVLVPEGTFGERVADAFRETFESSDGRVATEYRFQARAADLNAQIGAMLGVDESEARIGRLGRQLGLRLQGDPQIRADVDGIFIAGPARDLRMVVPHLHYHRAHRLPMLATSHAYEGRPQPMLDEDLSGLRFPDAPWMFPELNPEPGLRQQLEAKVEFEADGESESDSAAARLPRFAALGIDAGGLITELGRYRRAPQLEARGAAGNWAWQPLTRSWVREPGWFEFRNGTPVPVHAAPGPANDD